MAVLKSSFKAWNHTVRTVRRATSVGSIDLTAMVDLGLLLLVFFMWMEFLSKPKTITLNVPTDQGEIGCTSIRNSTVLTVLLGARHRVYYYIGTGKDPEYPPVVNRAFFHSATHSLRNVIMTRKAALADLQQSGELSPRAGLIVLIKPDETCTYEDLINALDEMAINNIHSYAVWELSDLDKTFVCGR